MKKIIALLLALVMVFALVACSSKTTDDTAKTTPRPRRHDRNHRNHRTTPAIPLTPPIPQKKASPSRSALSSSAMRTTRGYTYNFMRGKEAADEKLKAEGINVEWVIKWNLIEGDPVAVANEELAEDGCEIIFNNSYGHEPAC